MTLTESLGVAALAVAAGFTGSFFRDWLNARRAFRYDRELERKIQKKRDEHRRQMELQEKAQPTVTSLVPGRAPKFTIDDPLFGQVTVPRADHGFEPNGGNR